ncbi:SMP-30/gluconolactonase/LRE family protein [Hoeflea prorocentri]|uniref:SMP-30/gluconolactonase/LRE family protein n=1 Tax=Hoeflea prorocentri TaxID=1922333 RepID=A0A9X3UJY9_9HYPH|nr:SMP-30/gluconolactonase/LRE family protein [Hoeflea prorocentri]MCY6382238.1 SMP-30/gluconolactonase/LRE family protein [Hoeflea prorocentri]MDA5400038.1 SMP-30/gluconolactonase/LRE family protein [Hoeflea prorocentri]
MNPSDFDCTVFDDEIRELGEGPTFDPDRDTLWWFDIHGRKLIERRLSDAASKVHELPFLASALAVVDSKRQLLATEHGLYLRSVDTGGLERLVDIEADDASTRSNDSRVHPCGAFWIGTMGKSAQPNAGSIYHFFRGELRRIFTGITVTNCISFTADGSIAYFTDSPTGKVMRVATDPQTGLPTAEPDLFFERDAAYPGYPDGAVVDADGLVWIAKWQGSCVEAHDPSGSVVETITLPAWQITCPAFIGPDAARMIVTSATEGLSDAQLRDHPHAGKTFLLNRPMNGRYESKVKI